MSDVTVTLTYTADEARTAVSALRYAALPYGGPRDPRLALIADKIEAAIPKPKPVEPTGLGAVVVDDDGVKWVRTGYPSKGWLAKRDGLRWREWADISVSTPEQILSTGVES